MLCRARPVCRSLHEDGAHTKPTNLVTRRSNPYLLTSLDRYKFSPVQSNPRMTPSWSPGLKTCALGSALDRGPVMALNPAAKKWTFNESFHHPAFPVPTNKLSTYLKFAREKKKYRKIFFFFAKKARSRFVQFSSVQLVRRGPRLVFYLWCHL